MGNMLVEVSDYPLWLAKKKWTLLDAAFLACGFDPVDSVLDCSSMPVRIFKKRKGDEEPEKIFGWSNDWILPCAFPMAQLGRLTAYHVMKGFLNTTCAEDHEEDWTPSLSDFLVPPKVYVRWAVLNIGKEHPHFCFDMPRDYFFPSALREILGIKTLIEEFLWQGKQYFSYWQLESINLETLRLRNEKLEKGFGGVIEDGTTERILDYGYRRNYARRELTECGRWLTPKLHAAGHDVKPTLTFLHRIGGGGGGPPKAGLLWEDVKVSLQAVKLVLDKEPNGIESDRIKHSLGTEDCQGRNREGFLRLRALCVEFLSQTMRQKGFGELQEFAEATNAEAKTLKVLAPVQLWVTDEGSDHCWTVRVQKPDCSGFTKQCDIRTNLDEYQARQLIQDCLESWIMAIDEQRNHIANDQFGERHLWISPQEVSAGDPIEVLLDIEAATGTRLRDGEDPVWFVRVYDQYKHNHPGGVAFREFCARRFPEQIEVISEAELHKPALDSLPIASKTIASDQKRASGLTAQPAASARDSFPIPTGTQWADISIRFENGQTVGIAVGSRKRRKVSLAELGLMNRKTGEVNQQGALLKVLADRGGRLVKPQGENANLRQTVVRLRKSLAAYFQIEGDPIPRLDKNMRSNEGWTTAFKISNTDD